MRTKRIGCITQYFPERGFGWLTEESEGRKQSHFVHITSCSFVPEVGQVVTFTIGAGRKGPAAHGVELFQPKTEGAE